MTTHTKLESTDQRLIPHNALIVVCDSERSLFLINVGTAKEPKFQEFNSLDQPSPSERAQPADRPGRMNDGPGAHRSAMEETDRDHLETHRFARSVADLLQRAAHQDAYEDLVLVAAPHVLGELRSQLHDDVKRRVIAEIDKNLAHHPIDAIQRLVLAS